MDSTTAGRRGGRTGEALRGRRGGPRRRLPGGGGGDLRLPRAQRRRQVHHHQHPVHAGPADRRHAPGSPATTCAPSGTRCAASIGLVFQDPTLDVDLTAEQNLRFHAELYGVPRAVLDQPHRRHAPDGRADRAARQRGADLLRRHEAPAGDRPRPAALAPGAVPGRADDRARPAEPRLGVGRTSGRCASARTSRSSSPRTTWTRRRTATASRSWTPAGSSRWTRRRRSRPRVGKDRVQITTADDEAAIAALRGRFGIEAGMHSGEVTFAVRGRGALRAAGCSPSWACPSARSASSSPSLDDVFLAHTGSTIRDAESSTARADPAMFRAGRR